MDVGHWTKGAKPMRYLVCLTAMFFATSANAAINYNASKSNTVHKTYNSSHSNTRAKAKAKSYNASHSNKGTVTLVK
jgi:hypothetical protein